MEIRGRGKNKGADQLRGFHEGDQRLCFQRCKDPVFSRSSSYLHDRRAELAHSGYTGRAMSVQ